MVKTPAISSMAYVDTSAILSIVFEEPDWELTAHRLAEFPVLLSSNLLEAEMRSATHPITQATRIGSTTIE